MCRLLLTAASRTGGCVHQQPRSPSEMVLQHCGEPVSSIFQLLQGKLNIMALLVFIIPVPVFVHFWLSDNFLSTSLYFWLVYSHLHQFMDAKACTLCLNSIQSENPPSSLDYLLVLHKPYFWMMFPIIAAI